MKKKERLDYNQSMSGYFNRNNFNGNGLKDRQTNMRKIGGECLDEKKSNDKNLSSKKMIGFFCLISLLLLPVIGTGCAQTDSSSVQVTETESVNTEKSSETDSAKAENTETAITGMKQLTLKVINDCGADIGMFSIIDPVADEQVELSALEKGQSLSTEMDWPKNVFLFQWAVYNTNGELCASAKTDISSAQETVTLQLMGDGNLEDVKVFLDGVEP